MLAAVGLLGLLLGSLPGRSAVNGATPPPAAPSDRHEKATMWQELIEEHLRRYPALELADLYKLLHQATEGSEHAVEDRVSAAAWLDREIRTLGPGPEAPEPLIETLGRGGRYVRVHLRPFLAAGGDPARLLEAFVATAGNSAARDGALAPAPVGADRPHADSTFSDTDSDSLHVDLRIALSALEQTAAVDRLPWPKEEVAAFISDRMAEGFPAMHHSETYRQIYRPAYRVVAVNYTPLLVADAPD